LVLEFGGVTIDGPYAEQLAIDAMQDSRAFYSRYPTTMKGILVSAARYRPA